MREDRIILEHHANIALGRIQIVDHLVPKIKRTAFNGVESGDHPQQRRLAAAGRTKQGEKLPLMDIQVQIGNDDIVTVFFQGMLDVNCNAHRGFRSFQLWLGRLSCNVQECSARGSLSLLWMHHNLHRLAAA